MGWCATSPWIRVPDPREPGNSERTPEGEFLSLKGVVVHLLILSI